MRRREFIAAGLAAPPLWAKGHIDRTRVAVISDECARTPAEAIAFAREYGLKWLELRSVPPKGPYYATLPAAQVRAAAGEFAAAGLRISFLNTGLLKFALPGTDPVRRRAEGEEARKKRLAGEARNFERRLDDLKKAIEVAHILGADKLRVFTFSRVQEPEKLLPRIVEVLGEMAKVAEREKVQLLVENEGSCNVATCAELAALLKMIPSRAIGVNWDAMNGLAYKETPFPDGYALLPKKRIGNVQIKGRSLIEGPQRLDWEAIFKALDKDGYRGQVGLETHIFGPELIQHSHASMKEILRILGAA